MTDREMDNILRQKRLRSNIENQIEKLEKEILRFKPLGTTESANVVTEKQIAISNLYIALSNLK